jgi:hypothetical protein
MEAVSTSETSVSLYKTTRGNIPNDKHLLLPERTARFSQRGHCNFVGSYIELLCRLNVSSHSLYAGISLLMVSVTSEKLGGLIFM